jgi:hypothetical protein
MHIACHGHVSAGTRTRGAGANARCAEQGLPEAHSLDLYRLVSSAGGRAYDARIEAAAVEEREAPPYYLRLEHVRLPRGSRWRLWGEGEGVGGARHEGPVRREERREERSKRRR